MEAQLCLHFDNTSDTGMLNMYTLMMVNTFSLTIIVVLNFKLKDRREDQHLENLSSVSRSHFGLLTTACNFRTRESDVLFWPLCTPALSCIQTHTAIHKIKNEKITFKLRT